ncbi:hypothetical protein PVAP13_9KG651601 [Panicum virgatum]|uniref:Uncharacterized protein n=1 Tax=Panicum virgatum TaxID=38727 RepID=A0A8T0NZY1_PANVG|nr:hypothetical protein PVAP13_9KG651601 [Panicum virgatum]
MESWIQVSTFEGAANGDRTRLHPPTGPKQAAATGHRCQTQTIEEQLRLPITNQHLAPSGSRPQQRPDLRRRGAQRVIVAEPRYERGCSDFTKQDRPPRNNHDENLNATPSRRG